MNPVALDSPRSNRPRASLLLFVLIALFVFLSHAPFRKLPYYWDELGQFVPAALDLFQTGAWIPHSTVPNVHPPGVMAYLAGVWSVAGYSILATRLAMLLVASVAVFVVFQLARGIPGCPSLVPVLFLCVSPLFFSQAMLAALDMPAALFASLALLLFLQDRIRPAALACAVLVMVKETGLVAPMIFGCWLWFEKRHRDAAWFLLPLVPLAVWLTVLARSTGHLFGSAAFTEYNLLYPLHPVRLALALLRRLYYLFFGTFHWIGTLALGSAWRRTRIFRTRTWGIAASLAGAHSLLVSVLGGAVLERYLVPVLPILYIAFATAFSTWPARLRRAGQTALLAALVLANFWNPPYPYPLENNLAFTDFVTLHAQAAQYLESHYPGQKIATMFPLSSALIRPEFGYVRRRLPVREIYDFRASNVSALAGENVDVFVIYSVAWDPLDLLGQPRWVEFLRRFYGYAPAIVPEDLGPLLHMHPVTRWTRRGQWVEIYARPI